jgi:hypothetical protein
MKLEFLRSFLTFQLRLFHNHAFSLFDPYYGVEEYERIIGQSFLKTNYLLFTANSLITKGNYGAANILIRQIFEFLILGKYVSSVKDEEMALKWLDVRQFDIYDKVIKLLEKSNKQNFHNFWIRICKHSHATTVSHQIILNASKNAEDIRTSFALILLLQRCNYHLLSSCLLNRDLVYRSGYYGFKNENSKLKNNAKELKKEIYKLFTSSGKELLRDYEGKWVFKK